MAPAKANSPELSRPCAPDPMRIQPFVVRHNRPENHDTFTLDLAPLPGGEPLQFLPGQFNMLYAFGVGEAPISISGDPAKPHVLIHTIRTVGSVTQALRRVSPGDTVGIRGPYGRSWPVAEIEGRDVIIVSGGIGLAPLRPVIYHLLNHREKFGKVVLLYGTRTPDDIIFRKELERWRGRFDIDVLMTVDRAAGSWHGNIGVVTTLMGRAAFDPSDAAALVCGPEVMMRFAALELLKRGMPADQVFISMERNMKCGIGLCGHCQIGAGFVCKDGPVYRYDQVREIFARREM